MIQIIDRGEDRSENVDMNAKKMSGYVVIVLLSPELTVQTVYLYNQRGVLQCSWCWGETVTGSALTVATDAVKVKLISDLSQQSLEDLIVTIQQKYVWGD